MGGRSVVESTPSTGCRPVRHAPTPNTPDPEKSLIRLPWDGEAGAWHVGRRRATFPGMKEPVILTERTYSVLFQPEPEGGFTVTCPSLPGLVSYGATLEEARAMARDAIAGYLECLRE